MGEREPVLGAGVGGAAAVHRAHPAVAEALALAVDAHDALRRQARRRVARAGRGGLRPRHVGEVAPRRHDAVAVGEGGARPAARVEVEDGRHRRWDVGRDERGRTAVSAGRDRWSRRGRCRSRRLRRRSAGRWQVSTKRRQLRERPLDEVRSQARVAEERVVCVWGRGLDGAFVDVGSCRCGQAGVAADGFGTSEAGREGRTSVESGRSRRASGTNRRRENGGSRAAVASSGHVEVTLTVQMPALGASKDLEGGGCVREEIGAGRHLCGSERGMNEPNLGRSSEPVGQNGASSDLQVSALQQDLALVSSTAANAFERDFCTRTETTKSSTSELEARICGRENGVS